MTILYDENICVRCLACVSESECGGITYDGQIHFDATRAEDWDTIAAICPVDAIRIGTRNQELGTSICTLTPTSS